MTTKPSTTHAVPPVAATAVVPAPSERAGEEWLRRLRIVAVAVPAAFILLVLVLRVTFISGRWPDFGHLVLDAALVAGSVAFGVVMFSLIDRSYRAVLQENRDLAAVDAVVEAGRSAFSTDEVAQACLRAALEVTGSHRALIRATHPADTTRAADRWEATAHHTPDSAPENGPEMTVALLSGPEAIGSLTLCGLSPSSLSESAYTGIGRAIGTSLQRARYLAHLQQECHDGARAERGRIAREMHDGLAQALGATHLRLHAVMAHPDLTDKTRNELADIADTCHDAYVDVREGILGLGSARHHDRSLTDALDSYVRKFARQSGIRTTFDAPPGELDLPPHHEIQVIRIVQEALTNVRKHSGATRARVRISHGIGAWHFVVEDDGAGFDARAVGDDRFGLTSMSERTALVDGWLTVDSSPGEGTRILVGVPDPRGDRTTAERTPR
ncbi:MAG: sensor histidine kinase [Mobilicoccus sp.]|nr:sensor histidine kinase [Mobilicoccus sp.]